MDPASSTSFAFYLLMIVFLGVIAVAMFIVAFKDPAMLVVFGGLLAALCAMGLVAKFGMGAAVSAVLDNNIIAFIALVAVIGIMLWLGRTIERRLVVIGMVLFSAMLILFPQMVRRQVLLRFIKVSVGVEGYVVMGGVLYAIASIMNAHLLSE